VQKIISMRPPTLLALALVLALLLAGIGATPLRQEGASSSSSSSSSGMVEPDAHHQNQTQTATRTPTSTPHPTRAPDQVDSAKWVILGVSFGVMGGLFTLAAVLLLGACLMQAYAASVHPSVPIGQRYTGARRIFEDDNGIAVEEL
jgi:hypothetical protein